MRVLPLAFVFLVLLSACARQSTRENAPAPDSGRSASSSTDTANAVLFRALALVGTPYHYGGNTPESGFDCSGLVGYVFRDAAGINLPRTSTEMGAIRGREISVNRLQSGDLVLFAAKKQISHVGIYVGEGRFVHAPNRGGTVRLDRLDAQGWRESFLMGKRVID